MYMYLHIFATITKYLLLYMRHILFVYMLYNHAYHGALFICRFSFLFI